MPHAALRLCSWRIFDVRRKASRMARNRKFATVMWLSIVVALIALLYWPSETSQRDNTPPKVLLPHRVVGMKDVFLALMPLVIGLTAIGLMRGGIVLRDKHTRQPTPIAG